MRGRLENSEHVIHGEHWGRKRKVDNTHVGLLRTIDNEFLCSYLPDHDYHMLIEKEKLLQHHVSSTIKQYLINEALVVIMYVANSKRKCRALWSHSPLPVAVWLVSSL